MLPIHFITIESSIGQLSFRTSIVSELEPIELREMLL